MKPRYTKPREFFGIEPGSIAVLAPEPGTRGIKPRISGELEEKAAKLRSEDVSRQTFQAKFMERFYRENILRNFRHEVLAHWRLTDIALEKRRQRLRELLEAEDSQFMDEVFASGNTIEQRVVRLKEKVKYLREDKARMHSQLTKEKYDQQFRETCEEWRAKQRKQMELAHAYDLQKQLEMKKCWKADKNEREDFYKQMWEEKCQQDLLKEAQEKQQRAEMEKALQQSQLDQIHEKEAKKMEAQLAKEDAMRERMEMERQDAATKEEEEQLRRAKMSQVKQLNDENIALKRERLAAEKAIEKQIDDLYGKQIAESLKEAESTAVGDKRKRAVEAQQYLAYVEKLKSLEAEEDKIRDEIMLEAEKKMMKKMAAEQRALKQKRLDFMHELKEEMMKDEARKAEMKNARLSELRKEREKILAVMKQIRQEEEAEQMARLSKMRDYNDALQHQLRYNEDMRFAMNAEKERERAKMKEAEEAYQNRINSFLQSEWGNPRIHPWRRKALAEGTLRIPANPLEYSSVFYEPEN